MNTTIVHQISAILNKHDCGKIGGFTPPDEYIAEAGRLIGEIKRARAMFGGGDDESVFRPYVRTLLYCEFRLAMFPHEIEPENSPLWDEVSKDILSLPAFVSEPTDFVESRLD